MTEFQVIPAVDITHGKVAQIISLLDRSTLDDDNVQVLNTLVTQQIADSPLAVMKYFADRGAQWVHLVDIDQAYKRSNNRQLLKIIMQKTNMSVELSGGIDDEDSFLFALNTSARRINLGTRAIADWSWVEQAVARAGNRLAICLDVVGEQVVSRGAKLVIGALTDVLKAVSKLPIAALVVTDNRRDGNLAGPPLALYKRVALETGHKIIASGGVANESDLCQIRDMQALGVQGVIIGKAFYAGTLQPNCW